MRPLDIDRIREDTLSILSDIESELYYHARHSSLLGEIADFKHWLTTGQKRGAFQYTATVDGKVSVRDVCDEVFDHLGASPASLVRYCESMDGIVGNGGYYAIRFNTDEECNTGKGEQQKEKGYLEDAEGYIDLYTDSQGDIIVPAGRVLLTVYRGGEVHVEVDYDVFFHALRRYLTAKRIDSLAERISLRFGLTEESDSACEWLSMIPVFLSELMTEMLFARIAARHRLREPVARLTERS